MSSAPAVGKEPPRRDGLAVGSLALGTLALLLSPFLVGALPALIGLALGIAHLVRRSGSRGLALWGTGLSAAGLMAALGAGVLYYYAFTRFQPRASPAWSEFAAWHGREAPALSLRTIDGEAVETRALRGRPVVLNFWATWCGPCKKEIPHLDRLSRDGESGVVVVSVSEEDTDTLREFRGRTPMSYAVVSADDLPAPFDQVQAFPTTFFIGADGRIRSVVIGYQDFDALKSRAMAAPGAP
jgi:thiol-disulfide isomerase/thioredoxin